MDELERLLRQSRMLICRKCGGRMEYMDKGTYRCNKCGTETLDDFGKVLKYLEEKGPAPILTISRDTGVSGDVINGFLIDGRIELPDNSYYYVHCEKCGCDIRYGRFCPECTAELAKGIQGQMNFRGLGERPKQKRELDSRAKMRFIQE